MRKEFNWGPGLFLIIYQSLLLLTLPFYFYYSLPSWSMIGVSLILLWLTGLSITAGYHRLYAHRSYRTHPVIEGIILFFGAMAGQGSALRWAFDHRLHHAHVDTDDDPYSINKGFWYAHFLWILEKPREIESKVVSDLIRNPLVQFQHRYSELLMVFTNVIFFALIGWLLNDYLGSFFLACWTRLFALHHFTWFINSLAHTWGDKPFCQEQSAVNNYIIALLTFGEGYHNFHHTFANDYRNGIRWYHFDPTKWLIWTLNRIGLATSLKQVDPLTIKKRLVIERKNLLLERLSSLCLNKKEEIENKIHDLSDRLMIQLASFNQLKEHYQTVRRQAVEKATLKNLKIEIRILKKHLKADWRSWWELSRDIFNSNSIKLS
jgi:stearoyl-CoA desaturase (delta-9 desaturase)